MEQTSASSSGFFVTVHLPMQSQERAYANEVKRAQSGRVLSINVHSETVQRILREPTADVAAASEGDIGSCLFGSSCKQIDCFLTFAFFHVVSDSFLLQAHHMP